MYWIVVLTITYIYAEETERDTVLVWAADRQGAVEQAKGWIREPGQRGRVTAEVWGPLAECPDRAVVQV